MNLFSMWDTTHKRQPDSDVMIGVSCTFYILDQDTNL